MARREWLIDDDFFQDKNPTTEVKKDMRRNSHQSDIPSTDLDITRPTTAQHPKIPEARCALDHWHKRSRTRHISHFAPHQATR
jgi:hypothetical protein